MGREDHDKGQSPPPKPHPSEEPYVPGKYRFEPAGGPQPAGPQAAGPQAAEPQAAEPQPAEPLAAEPLAAAKAALRAQLMAGRLARTADERAAAGRALRDAVLSAPEAQMAGTVAAYFSVGSEPDTRGLVFALWKRGTYVLLPLLRPDGDLDWASYEGPDSVRSGPRGLLEPTEPPRGVTAITSADLIIVPALGADRSGVRLGRGGGSYDRALARVGPQVLTIALLYDGELRERVPGGPHDIPVRAAAQPAAGITRLG